MSAIKLQTASEILGVTSSALVISKKYKPFYTPSTKGSRNATFDLDGYKKKESLIEELQAQVSLFTEYLVHMRGWTYQRIADEAKVSMQAVNTCSLGYTKSLQLAYIFREKFGADFKAYHDYYGYKAKR